MKDQQGSCRMSDSSLFYILVITRDYETMDFIKL